MKDIFKLFWLRWLIVQKVLCLQYFYNKSKVVGCYYLLRMIKKVI